MNSKDRFDAEKWDSIDEVNTSVVPQYEFEDAENNNQSNSFVAEKWFVEEEDKIEPTVKKKESENNSVQNGSTINQKSENNSVSKLQATSNKKGKLVKILVAAVLIIVIIGGLGYFAFSDSLRLNQVCRYVENNDFESATSTLSQMKPSLETVAVENLIKYAEAYHAAEGALDSLTQTNQNENLATIDELKNSHESFIDEDKINYLPEQIRSIYNDLEDNYQNKFSSIKTDSIKSYFQLNSSWSNLIVAVRDFEMNYALYEKDEKGYYSKLKKNLDDFQEEYDSFNAYDSIPDKYQSKYDEISKKATKLYEYDFDYLEELFDNSQSSFVYNYKYWTDKSFIFSINKMQNYVDVSETSCNELKDELSNMFSSFDNSPSYIWSYVSDCECEYEALQSNINRDKKKFTNSEELGSADYDKNYTTTDYFVGFYDTKNENETRKNAEIAVNILKAYLLVGDKI